MSVSPQDFDYRLPPELIAQQPLKQRAESRLMVLDRSTGGVEHRRFADLPDLLRPGDLLVLNDTRVIPARFFARRTSGGLIEGLFLHERPEGWEVMLRNASRCRSDERLAFREDPSQGLTVRRRLGEGRWLVEPDPPGSAEEILLRVGRTPLPPYIRRKRDEPDRDDRRRYQTVFARRAGAVAAPTAGLHFTDELFARLAEIGVQTARLTLHVGPGTFAPVKADKLSEHRMHREWYTLPEEAVESVERTRNSGGRVVAVGTTAVRVLESVAREHDGRLHPSTGWTQLFLYPPAEFHVVDALITNFHLPRSTLLMLVAAFCRPGGTGGIGTILSAYEQAVRERYRFYSYGDAMLIV
jgi:S-adenosylmethionine:tRNA ribosyltransferase-isomerase